MKKSLLLSVFIFCLLAVRAEKGLYVDNFAAILGNTASEDSLLNYASSNHFTYLALYELHLVHASNNLTTVGTSAPLATFINKAKAIYGIQKIGACGENFWWFDNIISVYNSIHSNSNERIDVYNFEFEFWNLGSVGPGQYYCTTYLQPGGYSCDTSGAFAFYIKEIKSIDSLATIDGVTSELYVGWFNQHQALQMIPKVDRFLLHSYVTNVGSVYSYTQTRLSYLGSGIDTVQVMPIFSAEPSFLGPWVSSNPESGAYDSYTADFNAETGVWKSNINMIGYQWFAYTFMPYNLPSGINEENLDWNIYPNPTSNTLHIQNEQQASIEIFVFNMMGKLVAHQNSDLSLVMIDLEDLSPGVYSLFIRGKDQTISQRIVKH